MNSQSTMCELCGNGYDGSDIRAGGICGHCGLNTCKECWAKHSRSHYTPTLTIGGESISKFSTTTKKPKPKATPAIQTSFKF